MYNILVLNTDRKYIANLKYPFLPIPGDIIHLNDGKVIEVIIRVLPTKENEDFIIVCKYV